VIRFDTFFLALMTTLDGDAPLFAHCFSKEIIMKAWMAAASVTVFAATAMATGAAQAGDVSWSVTVGSPRPAPRVIYAPPPVVQMPPAVVYTPPPVVYAPAPVVYRPAPVMYPPVMYPPVMRPPVPMVYSAPPMYRMPPGHLKRLHQHPQRSPAPAVYAQPRPYFPN
jgi:hypothetical protein